MRMSDKLVRELKWVYRHGLRIVCDYMDDPRPIERGTIGTIDHVDDAGQIHVRWDNGRYLALCPEVDGFHLI